MNSKAQKQYWKKRYRRQRLTSKYQDYMRRYYQEHKNIMKARAARRTQKKQAELQRLKVSFGCRKCGERDPRCLQFHHRNPNEKKFDLPTWANASKKRLQKELNKCEILCANCHAKEHVPDLTSVR